MIHFVDGDLFAREANVRVNACNCVGVMGAGIALEFKRRWPQMFEAYQSACRNRVCRPGSPHVWASRDVVILNLHEGSLARRVSIRIR